MWYWRQRWIDVLFLHWRVDAGALRRHVPSMLELDTWQGDAWLSVVLFKLKVRPCWLPYLPGLSDLVEVNLRTYVRLGDRPGIYFLNVHADNRLAMWLANRLSPMRYEPARMKYVPVADTGYWCHCASRNDSERRLALQFRPDDPARSATDNPLESWLLERYRLYLEERPSQLCWVDVEHPPWNVHGASVRIHRNTLGDGFGLTLAASPEAIHFSSGLSASFGEFQTGLRRRPRHLTPCNEDRYFKAM